MDLSKSKPLWQSETFWGLFIAVAGPAVSRYGIALDDSLIPTLIEAGTILVGTIMAIHGRIAARTRVTLL